MSKEFEASSQAGFSKDRKSKNLGFVKGALVKAAILAPAIGYIACGGNEKKGVSPTETFTPNNTPTPERTIEPPQTPELESTLEPREAKSYTDPFAYCASIGTVDAPNSEWQGSEIPNQVIDFFLQKESLDPEYYGDPKFYKWRCVDGSVWGCFVGVNLPCQMANESTEPLPETITFCQLNPDSAVPLAAAGHNNIYLWRCEGKTPAIERQIYEVDSQGFITQYWHIIPK